MKYKRRSTGEEKVQKIAAGEEGNYRMERVPLKQTDRHHKSPGGDLCIRDSSLRGGFFLAMIKNLTVVGFNDFTVGVADQYVRATHIGPVRPGTRRGQVT